MRINEKSYMNLAKKIQAMLEEEIEREIIMAWDDKAGRAAGGSGDKYVVLQVVLTEKLLGTGSGTASLTNLQAEINKQAAKGYRLHTISTTSSGAKGFLGGDKIQATMVFERIN